VAIDDDDRSQADEASVPADRARRAQGTSPVVEAGNRGPFAKIAIFVGLLAVVGFLFMTAGGSKKPQATVKPPVQRTAQEPDTVPAPPAPPPLPALPADEALAGFPAPPVPGRKAPGATNANEAATAANKVEARRRAPMLVYDVSATDAASSAASPKPTPADALQSILATQLARNGAVGAGNDGVAGDGGKAGDAAEQRADRTQAFAHSASTRSVDQATAHRITLDDRVAQGRLIAATLETAVSSDLPGSLRAVVSRDVWSEDGKRRLIQRGSRLIGEYRSGLARGQTRVFVIWTRLLQPDGTDIALGSPGTDDLGRAGLTGAIDRHFAERFGASILLSLIGSTTTASQGGNTVVLNTSQSFSQVAEESLRDGINIPPTILIEQGSPVQVLVGRDLVFGEAPSALTATRP
jgi:type IV secretion system protein VirB10